MRIKLFGSPSVWDGERQVGGALAQRRRLALVVVLAAAAPPGRPAVSRERLLELLWPSDDEERSRAALSQALYAVRRDLGADDAIVGSSDLRLNPERVSCDYWEFLQALAEGAHSAAAELRSAALLEDFDVPEARTFGMWAEELSRSADADWERAAELAAERAIRDGDLAKAIRFRRALANLDPLSSRTAIALATVLAQGGDREAALRHLRVHSALVEQDLEAAPAPEVLALTAALQRGEVPPLPKAANASPAVAATTDALPDAPAPASDIAPAAPSIDARPAAALPTSLATPTSPALHPSPRRAATIVGVLTLAAVLAIMFARRPAVDSVPDDSHVDSMPMIAVGQISGDSLGVTVSGMLATNLSRAEDVEVVSSARMLELRGAFTDPGSGYLRAAREAGATELIEGTLARDGALWRLSLTRTDVRRGTVGASVRLEGRELFDLVDRASSELLEGLSRSFPTTSVTSISTNSLQAWQLYQEAVASQAAGRYDAARAQLRGALAVDSGFAMAAAALAAMYPDGSAERRKALRLAMRLRNRAPQRDADLIRAMWLVDENDPASAAVFDTLARKYPHDLEIRMNLANPALFQRADFPAAYAALASVWTADSVRIGKSGGGRCYACEAPLHVTTVAELQDSLAIAERWIRRYLRLAPDDGRAWGRLADVLERDVSRHAELAVVVERALRLGHTFSRGTLLLAATRRGDTAAYFAAERDLGPVGPDDVAAQHWNRTVLYRNIGRLDEAMREAQAYRLAKERREPASPSFRVLEAVVHLERGEGRLAAAIFDSIGRMLPGDTIDPLAARRVVWNRTLAATARYEAGDTAGFFALADSIAVLGLRSRYARDHYLHHHVRGLGWLAQGRLDDAIAELQRAIVFPAVGLTRTNWHLAHALRQRGRYAEARRTLEAAARGTRDGGSLYLNPLKVRAALRELR